MVLPSWLTVRDDGCILSLHVQPGAKKAGIAGEHGGALKIRVDSPPVDGRANQALIAFLAGYLGCPRGNFQLLSGESSRHKRVLVAGLAPDELVRRMTLPA